MAGGLSSSPAGLFTVLLSVLPVWAAFLKAASQRVRGKGYILGDPVSGVINCYLCHSLLVTQASPDSACGDAAQRCEY